MVNEYFWSMNIFISFDVDHLNLLQPSLKVAPLVKSSVLQIYIVMMNCDLILNINPTDVSIHVNVFISMSALRSVYHQSFTLKL